ncbi:hypothetical protein LTR85_009007 [Meristemomyces frigidus]|nr:hypothetical protein LTR85_009007 [Meristemomyces frigidus]
MYPRDLKKKAKNGNKEDADERFAQLANAGDKVEEEKGGEEDRTGGVDRLGGNLFVMDGKVGVAGGSSGGGGCGNAYGAGCGCGGPGGGGFGDGACDHVAAQLGLLFRWRRH